MEAIKELMPSVQHKHCVKHMWENMKLIFKDLIYKQILWATAGTGTKKMWEYYMEKLKTFGSKAYEWIIQKDPATWARAFFSNHVKSDTIQNNICESFNSYIKLARDLPILSML